MAGGNTLIAQQCDPPSLTQSVNRTVGQASALTRASPR